MAKQRKQDSEPDGTPGHIHPLPATPKGRATREKLLRVAKQTFEKEGYHRTSVSKICRGSGVAMGTFYRYFAGKREIFLFLARELGRGLQEEVEATFQTARGTVEELVRAAMAAFATFIQSHRAFYQIFREIEFVDRGLTLTFYDGLASMLARRLGSHLGWGVALEEESRVAAYSLIAVAYFASLRWIIWDKCRVPEATLNEAVRLIVEGIAASEWDGLRNKFPTVYTPAGQSKEKEALTRGERTRRELLRAAEKCFGEDGFWATSVADVTREAGVAQGAFYLYFKNKTEILSELVREIHRRLRETLRAAIASGENRKQVEELGFRAFFRFASRHPGIYRIVREAEFVDASVAQWYYQSLASAYARQLGEAVTRGEIRPFDTESLSYFLLGIGHFLGLRWVAWSPAGKIPESVVASLMRLLCRGLRAFGRDRPLQDGF